MQSLAQTHGRGTFPGVDLTDDVGDRLTGLHHDDLGRRQAGLPGMAPHRGRQQHQRCHRAHACEDPSATMDRLLPARFDAGVRPAMAVLLHLGAIRPGNEPRTRCSPAHRSTGDGPSRSSADRSVKRVRPPVRTPEPGAFEPAAFARRGPTVPLSLI